MNTAVLETEKLLSRLSRAEKAQILQWIVQDLGDAFPGIERTPNTSDGIAFVVRTRIPVWLLEQMRRLGATDANLLLAYPTLRAADLVDAWSYVRVHEEEINEAIALNDADFEALAYRVDDCLAKQPVGTEGQLLRAQRPAP